jgi:hypothetical protein
VIQHYIPRWYLKQWVAGGSDEVCVFGSDGTFAVRPIGLTGARIDWYTTFLAGGARDDTIELGLLQRVDSDGATSTRALLKNGRLGPRQWESLARFMGWFSVRGPIMDQLTQRVGDSLNARRERGELDEVTDVRGSTGLNRGGRRVSVPDGPFEFTHAEMIEVLKRNRLPEAIGAAIARRGAWRHLRRLGGGAALETCDAPVVWEDEVADSPEFAEATFLPLAPDALLALGTAFRPVPEALLLDDALLATRINALIQAQAVGERYAKPVLLDTA